MGIIGTIIIGFIAGLLAKFLTPGDNEPSGFILTTLLGIAGAFLATYLGQAIGWYRAGEGAGLDRCRRRRRHRSRDLGHVQRQGAVQPRLRSQNLSFAAAREIIEAHDASMIEASPMPSAPITTARW